MLKLIIFFKTTCDGLPFYVSNDADLAGLAEVKSRSWKRSSKGKVFVITIGTGIGSGLFYNGKLIPNVELGRIYHTDGEIIENMLLQILQEKETDYLRAMGKKI